MPEIGTPGLKGPADGTLLSYAHHEAVLDKQLKEDERSDSRPDTFSRATARAPRERLLTAPVAATWQR